MLKPAEVSTAPVADCDDHLGHVLSHLSEIAIARIFNELDSPVTLGESCRVSGKCTISFVHFVLDMEWLIGVDLTTCAWTVDASRLVNEDICGAGAWSIAVEVAAVAAVALVGSGSPGVLVSLHDVIFWAHVSANRSGIAVFEGVATVGPVRHDDGVKSSEAAAATLAEVHIEFNCTTEEVGPEVGVGIEGGLRRKVHSIVVVELKLGA